jgi:hypothetical protein
MTHVQIISSTAPYVAGLISLTVVAFVIAHALQKRRLDRLMVGRVEDLLLEIQRLRTTQL